MQSGMFAGKKTYITAVVAILIGWASYFTGAQVEGQTVATLADALQLTAIGLIGAFVRNGVAAERKS